MTVKILGICGSPIKGGNTEAILEVALNASSELTDVETEIFTIAGKKFNGCIHCNWCVEKQGDKPGEIFCAQKDDLTPLYSNLVEVDGLLIATPVYFKGISWQTSAFFSRQRCFVTGKLYRKNPVMQNKLLGGMAVAWVRNGGQEGALMAIHNFGTMLGMLDIGGVAASSSLEGSGRRDRENPDDKLLVLRDERAVEAAQSLGRRMADVGRTLKAGKESISNV